MAKPTRLPSPCLNRDVGSLDAVHLKSAPANPDYDTIFDEYRGVASFPRLIINKVCVVEQNVKFRAGFGELLVFIWGSAGLDNLRLCVAEINLSQVAFVYFTSDSVAPGQSQG